MDNDQLLKNLTEHLHKDRHSLVVYNGQVATFDDRGVSDLFRLLTFDPSFLHGAYVADKVVGKGAAALMILGQVHSLHADVISIPALELFSESAVCVSYGQVVKNIVNRKGDGICPVETLCMQCTSAEECLPKITEFINNLKK